MPFDEEVTMRPMEYGMCLLQVNMRPMEYGMCLLHSVNMRPINGVWHVPLT